MKFKRGFMALGIAFISQVAHADDWPCTVLLCMLNPQGPTAVAECVPPIKKLWRELAKGHGFPTCATGSSQANEPVNQWATLDNCPKQYLVSRTSDTDEFYCGMTGYITLMKDGQPFTRMWWGPSGNVTENLSSDAPITDSSIQFAKDYAAWQAEQARKAAANAGDTRNGS